MVSIRDRMAGQAGQKEEDRAFVGRGGELAALVDRLGAATASKGSAVVLLGEPGMGKTRLVDTFADKATDLCARVLRGGCEQGQAEPYLPFRRAMREAGGEAILGQDERISFTNVAAFDSESTVVWSSVEEGATSAASVVSVVQGFVQESFTGSKGMSGRLEFGGTTLLTERAGEITVAALVRGEEQPGMREALRSASSGLAAEGFAVLERLAEERFTVRRRLEGIRLDGERIKIAERATEYLSGLSVQSPIVLILEDMHWADDSTLHLLRYAARNLADLRVLIVATARPGEGAGDAVAALANDGLAGRIDLSRIGADGVAELAASVCGQTSLPRGFLERLADRCGGNPLFVLELVRQMLADGRMSVVNGTCVLVDEGADVPSSIDEVISRRLSTLSGEELALAEYASCEGRTFPVDVAFNAPGVSDPEAILARLAAVGIVSRDGDACMFTHALFQSAVYSGITPRWLTAHHRSLGERLERSCADDLESVSHGLARHFHLSNDHSRGFRYCIMAGARSEIAYAAEQALDYYSKAISHSQGAPATQIADLRSRAGDLLTLMGRYDEALSNYHEAARLACDPDQAAETSRKLSIVFEKKAAYVESLAELDAAESRSGHSPRTGARLKLQRASVLVKMGRQKDALAIALEVVASCSAGCESELGEAQHLAGVACWHSGDFDQALAHFDQSLAIRERSGDLQGLSNTYNNIGVVHSIRSDWQGAAEYFSKALELRRKVGDQEGISASHSNLGITYWNRRDSSKAIAEFNKSLEIARRIGDREGAGSTLNNIGNAYIQIGEVERALEAFKRSLGIRQEIGNQRGIAAAMNNIGFVLLHRGDLDEAELNLREGLRLREGLGDKRGVVTSLENMGRLSALRGDFDGSESWFTRTVDLCKSIGITDSLAVSLMGIAEAKLARGIEDGVEELMSEAGEVASKTGFDDFPAMLARTKGCLLALRNDLIGSDAAFEESVRKYDELLMETEAAMTRCIWSEALADRGETAKARENALPAMKVFSRKGMRLWEERARAVVDGQKPVS